MKQKSYLIRYENKSDDWFHVPMHRTPSALVEFALRQNIYFDAAWEVNGRFYASGSPSSLTYTRNVEAWGEEQSLFVHRELYRQVHNEEEI